ncbi:MAG TPA: hypothetical protein VJ044_09325, partial [Candidatus Hodarchaeales archaeon]|nr:hypothetical protein [Candidatus Hodarchaeales archaeon]
MSQARSITELERLLGPEITTLQRLQKEIDLALEGARSVVATRESNSEKHKNFDGLIKQVTTSVKSLDKTTANVRALLDEVNTVDSEVQHEQLRLKDLKTKGSSLKENLKAQKQSTFLVQSQYKDIKTRSEEFTAYLGESLKLPEALGDTFRAQEQIVTTLDNQVVGDHVKQESRLTILLNRLEKQEAGIEEKSKAIKTSKINSDAISELLLKSDEKVRTATIESPRLEEQFKQNEELEVQNVIGKFETDLTDLQKKLQQSEKATRNAQVESEASNKDRETLQKSIQEISTKRDQLVQSAQKKDETITALERQLKEAESQTNGLRDQIKT